MWQRTVALSFCLLVGVGAVVWAQDDWLELLKNGSPADIQAAIAAGADVNNRSTSWHGDGFTSLMAAIEWRRPPEVLTVLVSAGADVDAQNEAGETALMLAAWRNHLEAVRLLLEAEADVLLRTSLGRLAHDYAEFYSDNPRILELLQAARGVITLEAFAELVKSGSAQEVSSAIEAGAYINGFGKSGYTSLMIAARNNPDPMVIQVLLDAGANVNQVNWIGRPLNARSAGLQSGFTPLLLAAENNPEPEVIRRLITAGADIRHTNAVGRTALMQALQYNANPEVALILLDMGADPNQDHWDSWNKERITPLLLATRYSTPEVVQKLVDVGARVNMNFSFSQNTMSPLTSAITFGNVEMVKILLSAGANVNAWDGYGNPPLRASNSEIRQLLLQAEPYPATLQITRREFFDLIAMGSAAEVAEALAQGADIEAVMTPFFHHTVLWHALSEGTSAEVVQLLLDGGAALPEDVLFLAVQKDAALETFEVLLAAGADINFTTSTGTTVLMVSASDSPNPAVVLTLLQAGADPTLRDTEGKTAWDYAQDNVALEGTEAYHRLREMTP